MVRTRRILSLALLAAAVAAPALADPPSHAPAHGWRKKHDPYYQGYSGKKWDRDYGVLQGRCDARSLGETLGRSVGAGVGGQVGGGQTREIAVLVGEVIGGALGARMAQDFGLHDFKDIAGTDRACLAQALELAESGRKVAWTNPASNVAYLLTPRRLYERDGRQCRDFDLRISVGAERKTVRQTACATAAGQWEMRR